MINEKNQSIDIGDNMRSKRVKHQKKSNKIPLEKLLDFSIKYSFVIIEGGKLIYKYLTS